jgi:hypothetical protein
LRNQEGTKVTATAANPGAKSESGCRHTYETRDEAAKAAEKAALNATDKSGRQYEYGGWILKNKYGCRVSSRRRLSARTD